MIKIFYTAAVISDIPKEISPYRLKKITDVKHDGARTDMLRAAVLLKAGFASYGINEKDVTYTVSKNGKPCCKSEPQIHFSIAHTKNSALVAFCENEIGIDCENSNRKVSQDILLRHFSKEEREAFSNEPLLLWVAKESIAKQSGDGLALSKVKAVLPYFDGELKINGLWLKRIDLPKTVAVICAAAPDEIEIHEIK